jgi:hypothetical protein
MFSCKLRNLELKFLPYVGLVILRLYQKFQRKRMFSSEVNAIAKNTCISQRDQKIRCFLKIDYLQRKTSVYTETFQICSGPRELHMIKISSRNSFIYTRTLLVNFRIFSGFPYFIRIFHGLAIPKIRRFPLSFFSTFTVRKKSSISRVFKIILSS